MSHTWVLRLSFLFRLKRPVILPKVCGPGPVVSVQLAPTHIQFQLTFDVPRMEVRKRFLFGTSFCARRAAVCLQAVALFVPSLVYSPWSLFGHVAGHHRLHQQHNPIKGE